ncbi:MAG: hypothetical protein KDB22_18640 [Planctomycetales bacterium]|nr:hypothetical protein [Planctomycetales bacterium]
MWNEIFGQWLIHSAFFGTVILLVGVLAVALMKEPVYRISVIRWTFLACLLVPLLQQSHLLPSISLAPQWSFREVPSDFASGARRESPSPVAAAGTRHDQSHEVALQPVAPSSSVLPQVSSLEPQTLRSTLPMPVTATGEEAVVANHWLLRSSPSLGQLVQVAYAICVLCLLVLWCKSLLFRWRISEHASPASKLARTVLAEIAPHQSKRTRLLVSEQITSPIMWGWLRPTIVIPRELGERANASALRWGLAHECSHVMNHDFATHLISCVVKLACFYQPAYWWLRQQLISCQDYVADAFAAQQGDSNEDYAQFLVNLAGKRRGRIDTVILGIGSHPSKLAKRVQVLLASSRPLQQKCQKTLSAIIAVAFCSMALALSSLSFTVAGDEDSRAAPTANSVTQPQTALVESEPVETEPAQGETVSKGAAKLQTQTEPEQLPEPLTYQCRVVDRDTNQGIAGARVEITLEYRAQPSDARHSQLDALVVNTDKDGNYQFTIKPEFLKIPSLYIVVDAHHADYQSMGRGGYSHAMIRTNLANGDPPFYQTIRLSPGKQILGRVITPLGTPSANTEVTVYAKRAHASEGSFSVRGSFQKTETDHEGRFQLTIATPGDGVLWISPKDYSPMAIRLRDRRGDLGNIELQQGTQVAGQLFDAEGHEIEGLVVSAQRRGDGEDVDEFLGANAVGNGIRGRTTTAAEGKFVLPPLPPGDYTIGVSLPRDDKQGFLPYVFTRSQLTIPVQGQIDPIEVRALPHVIVRGRFFDGQGNPRSSHEQHIFAQFRGDSYFAQSTKPTDDGWFEFRVPHGSENVQVSLITNEHSSLRWRTTPDEEFTYGFQAALGTLEEDFTTLEFIRYQAPMLLLKAVDEDGNQITGFKPRSRYKTRSKSERMGVTFVSGALGDVGFEEQSDGRWRSSQMLPNDEVTISLEKDGYTTEPQQVTMKEGENRELVFVLKKSL